MAEPLTTRARRAPRARPLLAGLVLLLAYVALSAVTDPGGYLGTDTGAKVATLEVMVERDSWRPELGYWAESLDPDGDLHPVYDALPRGDDWVHVTTLPMLVAARPLYELGGYRLALLLPMLGAVAAAFAARALATRLGGDPAAGWFAFWLVGLGGPMAVYALDLWEHAPGAACMVAAVAVLAGVVDGDRHPAWGAVAGALLGTAATMRTEAFVYTMVAVGVAAALLALGRRVREAATTGVAAVAGFAVPWAANGLLEGALNGVERSDRVASVTSRGLDDLALRGREAATTMLAIRPSDGAELIGVLVVALVVGAVLAAGRRPELVRPLLLATGALHLAVLAGGPDFVPGLLVAAPAAVVGLLAIPAAGPPSARYVWATAVLALPVVWAFQYTGGARPQWAGRYILVSGLLLVVLGAVRLHRSSSSSLRWGVVALSALVTASGVVWLAERSHSVDDYFAELVERPEEVIVVRNGFFVREGGAAYVERRWLTAVSDEDLDAAIEVVERSGATTFGVLDNQPTAAPTLAGATLVGTTEREVAGTAFFLHSYRL
jgi:hypothetical protein